MLKQQLQPQMLPPLQQPAQQHLQLQLPMNNSPLRQLRQHNLRNQHLQHCLKVSPRMQLECSWPHQENPVKWLSKLWRWLRVMVILPSQSFWKGVQWGVMEAVGPEWGELRQITAMKRLRTIKLTVDKEWQERQLLLNLPKTLSFSELHSACGRTPNFTKNSFSSCKPKIRPSGKPSSKTR